MAVNGRDGGIDVLRGVSILLVLLHHFNIAYPLKGAGPMTLPGWAAMHALARNGNYGVTIFFVVSGFLITRNTLERWGRLDRVPIADFYVLRAARILPCLLLTLIAVDALALVGVGIFENRQGALVSLWMVNVASLTFWVNVLITQHGWINYPLGVLWSLSIEVVFYLLFPLACLGLRRRPALLALAVVLIGAGPIYRYTHQGVDEAFLYGYLACFDAIVIGCSAAVLAPRVSLPAGCRRPLRAAIMFAMAVLYLAWPIGESNVFGVTAMAMATALLLLGGCDSSFAASATRSTMTARVLAACGRRSYEIYLFHLIVLGLLRTLVPPGLASGIEKIGLLVLYFAFSGMVAAVVARLWSDRFNSAIRRRFLGGIE